MTRELWRQVEGWPYEVSDLGRVRRAAGRHYKNSTKDGVLREVTITGGYKSVSLSRDNGVKNFLVHRLVAVAFLGPPPTSEHEVAHGDGSRTNNAATNLRWATPKENMADREAHGRTARGSRIGLSKLTERDVALIRRAGLTAVQAARAFEVSENAIRRILKGDTWRHVT